MTFQVSIKVTLCLVLAAAALPGLLADSISVKKSCYQAGESIGVRFATNSSEDLHLNWIGIYQADDFSYSRSLPAGEMWVNLCGKQSCDPYNSPQEGTVQFQSKYQSWLQSWPLRQGSYVAVLSSDQATDTWPVLAVSEVFEIGCDDRPALRTSRTSRISNAISVNQDCFDNGDQIEVKFSKSSSMNLEKAWVAIVDSHSLGNSLRLPPGELWVNLCGSQSCNLSNNPIEGSVIFRPSVGGWIQSWPLKSGSYVAVLVEGGDGDNLVALAVSRTFEIGCNNAEGPDPRNSNAPQSNADEVSVSKECYDAGEPIMVDFLKGDNGTMARFGWIGIYRSDKIPNTGNLKAGEMWANLCGSQTCVSNQSLQRGTVHFQSPSQSWLQSWPLVEGSYVAVLTGQGAAGWHVRASSKVFKVGGCDSRSGGGDTGDNGPISVDRSEMVLVIADARAKIRTLIQRNKLLAGKFLRLAFHDCVGGCDGCVDMANDDNAGLVMPIRSLEAIVKENEPKGLSRTDIWMLAAVVASEVTEVSRRIDFPFQWIGRKTCEEIHNNDCGLNAKGQKSRCEPLGGPHHELCHGDISGTRTIHNFMRDEFGFDAQKTAAIMGAHSIGAMRNVNLGFEGRNGWDLTNDELDHGYYLELVGDSIVGAPNWKQVLQRNDHLNGIPSRWQYEARVSGVDLTMLNSDIAMVRNLVEGENLDSEGKVSCDFSGANSCDSDTPFMPFIRRYADSRTVFLEDYREALDLMIENGYSRDSQCGAGEVCKLRSLF